MRAGLSTGFLRAVAFSSARRSPQANLSLSRARAPEVGADYREVGDWGAQVEGRRFRRRDKAPVALTSRANTPLSAARTSSRAVYLVVTFSLLLPPINQLRSASIDNSGDYSRGESLRKPGNRRESGIFARRKPGAEEEPSKNNIPRGSERVFRRWADFKERENGEVAGNARGDDLGWPRIR